ncbi:unnamed protein product [Sphenostylis stenocarpa]|uniref:Uncharacterized protein n=1 Tax=Sphenostylis stenocarpa TaxID=92480 RepID=A0AA86SJZ4_9FABA|nr:unnamed protein product [Sphenostylis stenocarpa]
MESSCLFQEANQASLVSMICTCKCNPVSGVGCIASMSYDNERWYCTSTVPFSDLEEPGTINGDLCECSCYLILCDGYTLCLVQGNK